MEEEVPPKGKWPIDPQDDEPVSEDRIWIDGCFDFSHHGHAGAMLQARRLGTELFVGIHSDEEILINKGPSVMTLEERVASVSSNRWTTKVIPHAPYITSLPWVRHYGCQYVVHGDDITSDASGNDCYRFVKAAGQFKMVKRTPGISTTDLVGRMLLCTKIHFIKNVEDVLKGHEGHGDYEERMLRGIDYSVRLKDFSTDETGYAPKSEVWIYKGVQRLYHNRQVFHKIISGQKPRPDQRIVYVDGGFDLFTPGHAEFLHKVTEAELAEAQRNGWYSEQAKQSRLEVYGQDYPPFYLIVGVHDDETINSRKGLNYPIMNILERSLCILQCRYTDLLLMNAPYILTREYLSSLPYVNKLSGPCSEPTGREHQDSNTSHKLTYPSAVYHGPTAYMSAEINPYSEAHSLGILRKIESHRFNDLNAGVIVQRIVERRSKYEERQRAKSFKNVIEDRAKYNENCGRELDE